MAHDVLITKEQEVIVVGGGVQHVLREEVPVTQVVAVAVQGPPGIQGPAGGAATARVGAWPLSGHSAVALDASGQLVPADCRDADHRGAVVGLVAEAYAPGAVASVNTALTVHHAGWSWSLGPVFVGMAGGLVQHVPAGAVFAQVVGFALSPTLIAVDVQPPIHIT